MRRTWKLVAILSLALLLRGGGRGGNGGGNDNSGGNGPGPHRRGGGPVDNTGSAQDAAEARLTDGQVKDSTGDGKPDLQQPTGLPTRDQLPPFNISSQQFGKKWGKHSKDYDLDPADPNSRQWFQDRANQVHDSPDDVRVGPYNPNGGGGPDHVFFRQGDDLVIMKPNGDFVTMFPMEPGSYNGWYLDATPID